MFRLRQAMRAVDLSPAEVEASTPEGSILKRSTKSVSMTLERFRADEADLERDIGAMTERLRQTRIAITAFEAASGILAGGQQFETPPKKIGRLVPRAVPPAEPVA